MLTPEDVKEKQDAIQAIDEQIIKKTLQQIDKDSENIITDGIRNGTFNSRDGTIKFINLGIVLTAPQARLLNSAVKKFFESHGWVVDKLEISWGSTDEAPVRYASMEVRLCAKYKKPVS